MHNTKSSKTPKVLIVEDDLYSYLLLKSALKSIEPEIIWAKMGKEAIKTFSDKRDIDIVLMDIALPDINGYKVTQEIKNMKKNIPVVAVTAYALPGDREKCLSAGCDEYIPKPVSISYLYNVFEKWGISIPEGEAV
jgi:CheY-like chemotaxis protein